MKIKHFLYCAILLAAPLALTACNRAEQFSSDQSVQASSTQVHQLKNGLRVKVLPLEGNDIAQTLDMKMWKFDVALPKPEQMLTCNLEIRRNGKTIKRAGGVRVGPFKESQTEVFVSLHPVDDSWSKSDNFKSLVRIGPNSGAGFEKNPFMIYSSTAYGNAKLQPDGTFLLMVGSKGKSASWPYEKQNDVALVLTMEVEAAQFPK